MRSAFRTCALSSTIITSGSTFGILSSGDATFADDPNDSESTGASNNGGDGGHGPSFFDVVTLKVDVNVLEVRTAKVPSKPKRRGYTAGRTRGWKKAVVQVSPGQTIPIFQGLEADL